MFADCLSNVVWAVGTSLPLKYNATQSNHKHDLENILESNLVRLQARQKIARIRYATVYRPDSLIYNELKHLGILSEHQKYKT